MCLPVIIGLVGPVRAGKTTVAKYLVKKYGYTHASNSEVLVSILNSMNIVPSRENLQLLGNAMFENLGNDAIARARIANLGNKKLVVDGIRYIEEVDCYRKISGFKLIAVNASSDVRYARSFHANDSIKDKGTDKRSFLSLDKARSEIQVPKIMEYADGHIDNARDFNFLELKIDGLLNYWGVE